MELYCPVEFDEPETQEYVIEDYESMIASMEEEYYFYLEQENAESKQDISHESDSQVRDLARYPIEGFGNITDMAYQRSAYSDIHVG